jgi:CO dehydrogenase nickel-insertion accessory protein CooC1
VVANRVTPENRPRVDELAKEIGLEITAYVPFEPLVNQYDGMGKPVSDLPKDSPASKVIDEICQKILSYA